MTCSQTKNSNHIFSSLALNNPFVTPSISPNNTMSGLGSAS